MHLESLISSALIFLYGILNFVAGFSQLKEKKIQAWSAWTMIGVGLLLLISSGLLLMKLSSALLVLAIGLIIIHLLAIHNGLYLYGKINPSHHMFRLMVSAILFGLAFWALR
ncbi:MAG: hypothetical protein U0Z26_03870 [Anaerolineales bacterium]